MGLRRINIRFINLMVSSLETECSNILYAIFLLLVIIYVTILADINEPSLLISSKHNDVALARIFSSQYSSSLSINV